jgi:hypothetical protein
VIVVKNGGCNTSHSKQKLRISSLFPILLKYQRKICQPSGFSNSRKRHFLLQSRAHEFWNIVDQMSDKFGSQHSLSPTIWSDIVVGREWIFKDFFYISRGEHVKHFVIDAVGIL